MVIFMQSGLQTPELMQASANDMVIVAELRDEALMDVILKKTDEFFQQESRTKTASAEYPEASDWESRARAQGWQPARPFVGGRNGNGRQNRHLRRKG